MNNHSIPNPELETQENTQEVEKEASNSNINSEVSNEQASESISPNEINEWQDRYLRLASDFENYKKRTIKERDALLSNAHADILKVFLPVLDDFDRALKVVQQAQDIAKVQEGIELIARKLTQALERQGINAIDSNGKEFDSNLHEAIAGMPTDQTELKGKVIETVEKGYLFHEKVLRYAKVIVGE